MMPAQQTTKNTVGIACSNCGRPFEIDWEKYRTASVSEKQRILQDANRRRREHEVACKPEAEAQ